MFNPKLEVFLVTLVHPASSNAIFRGSVKGNKQKIKWLSSCIVIFIKNRCFVGKVMLILPRFVRNLELIFIVFYIS